MGLMRMLVRENRYIFREKGSKVLQAIYSGVTEALPSSFFFLFLNVKFYTEF